MFELNKTEGAQIYTLLQNAYSQSRYNSDFDPDEESIRMLLSRVKKLNHMAEMIYARFIQDID